ncbi:MAG: TetR/AcrR family transcriptional regulator [Gemmatimonadota bacterium]
MPRPREFDRDDVLLTAMEVFWTHGYEATTMTQLRHAMGLGRQSLYDTFGDKDALFNEALGRYISLNDADVDAHLGKNQGLDGIRRLFDARIDMLSSGARRGCLMMNSCVEVSPHNPDVAQRLRSGLKRMERGFASALDQAVAEGTVTPSTDVDALAFYLTAQIGALVVMAKNGATKGELTQLSTQALSVLHP